VHELERFQQLQCCEGACQCVVERRVQWTLRGIYTMHD
jgi:hypothetical protein